MSPSDEQLAASAASGDKSAFPELVRRYQSRLLRFLMTRSPSRADAEDALQDTFMNAYRYIASFDPRWRFSTWLYRIGIREAAKATRVDSEGVDALADPAADPLAHCLRESGQQNLWSTARRCLSDDAFTAMWLRYVEDMSLRDVARSLEKSESWAKVTLMRSRDRLAAELKADDANTRGKVYG